MPPFDPKQFLHLAETISVGTNPSEAEFRTSVGRAYYAVFLIARDRLFALGKLDSIERPDLHLKVVAGVRNIKRQLGDQLDTLRRYRGQADYVLSAQDTRYQQRYGNWQENWSRAQVIAQQIHTHIQNLQSRV